MPPSEMGRSQLTASSRSKAKRSDAQHCTKPPRKAAPCCSNTRAHAHAPSEHVGRSCVRITSLTVRMSRFPSFPAGWFIAYSSVVRFFACVRACPRIHGHG